MPSESGSAAALPLIDLAPFLAGEPGSITEVARQIGEACRSVGFFYLAGHGIAEALIEEVFALSRQFFAQDRAVKDELSIAFSRNNRGYVGLDSENLDPTAPTDAKEAFNLGREPDPGEKLASDTPSSGPNLWPDLPRFRVVMTSYYQSCRRLCERLHEVFATDLGLEAGFFSPYIDRPLATLRLLHYPPRRVLSDAQLGAGTHTDYGNLTILGQDDVGGLEVRTRQGEWISATPIPGTFVCNIGDCLMRWSNDVYVSTPHRVISSPTHERFSLAFFFDPNPDALIAALPNCIAPGEAPHYPALVFADYLRAKLDLTYGFRSSQLITPEAGIEPS